MRSSKPVLLIEDDSVDVMTVKRSLKEINLTNKLLVAGNGEEGLLLLRDGEEELPCIILLDINMPRMNGLEFLKQMREDEGLKHIPVIVMTTSREEQDKIESFRLGVSGYMLKPVNYVRFVELMKTIKLYWTLSEMPH